MHEHNNNLYKKFCKQNKDYDIFNKNGVSFLWNKKWNSIGINLSGGADSACLTYIIAEYITKNNLDCKIYPINFIRCWNTRPWQYDVAIRVYDKLKSMFPNIIQQRLQTYAPPEIENSQIGKSIVLKNGKKVSGEQIIVESFNNYCAYHYNLSTIFDATSANPPNAGELRIKERDLDLDKMNFEEMFHFKEDKFYSYRPFLYIRKDFIYNVYKTCDIMDLYNTTMSCEGDFTKPKIIDQCLTLDDYTPTQTILPCGKCWWCWERKWAEDEINNV